MFNSAYSGIESDGMYRNMTQEFKESEPSYDPPKEAPAMAPQRKSILGNSFLKNIGVDDLILIGIALLLLLDGEEDNDIFVFIIAALIFLT